MTDETVLPFGEEEELFWSLSPRQREVAILVVKTPLYNRDIALRLHVTEKTIKFHLTAIYRFMKVRNRSALIQKIGHLFNLAKDEGQAFTALVHVKRVREAIPRKRTRLYPQSHSE